MMRRFGTSAIVRSGNAVEMAHFAELASSWWDPNGPQRILHKMNLMRMDYINKTLETSGSKVPGYSLNLLPEHMRAQVQNKSTTKHNVLDIGCGGGLLSESLARKPQTSSVLGIDVTPEVIEVAESHRKLDPSLTNLSYKNIGVENLPKKAEYDLITMFEVLEHLDEPAHVLRQALDLLKPGGYIFMSTINRTTLAYLSTIFLGEDVLKIVPRGTHTWSKYINEGELRKFIEDQPDVQFVNSMGCIYLPTQGWVQFGAASEGLPLQALNKTIGIDNGNYLMCARKALSA